MILANLITNLVCGAHFHSFIIATFLKKFIVIKSFSRKQCPAELSPWIIPLVLSVLPKLFPLPSSFLLPPPCVDYLVPSPKATTFGKPCRWGKNLAQQLKNPHFPHHKNPYHPKAIFNSSFIYSCSHDSGINFFFQNLCADMSTAWKVSKYGVFSRPYFTVIGLNADQKKLRIWALFTQWSR